MVSKSSKSLGKDSASLFSSFAELAGVNYIPYTRASLAHHSHITRRWQWIIAANVVTVLDCFSYEREGKGRKTIKARKLW